VTRRSPARLLAPLALVVCAVALYTVVNSGSGETSDDTGDSARPAVTATASAKKAKKAKNSGTAKTYVVKAGDTPSGIAERAGVDLDALLAANPNADPNSLSPGQTLKLP
jgi:LysM repeat protein